MKNFLLELKRNKVNVSKFIREAIEEKRQCENLIKVDRRKKATINDLKESFCIFEKNLTNSL